PAPEDLCSERDSQASRALRSDFESLLTIRNEALKGMEIARKEKLIRRSEEAAVTISAPQNLYSLLERYRTDLRFLLIVSAVEIKRAAAGNEEAGVRVDVQTAAGQKCERCWFYSTEVGKSERYPTVCERCLAVLEELEGGSPA